jgi:hypothetical protein
MVSSIVECSPQPLPDSLFPLRSTTHHGQETTRVSQCTTMPSLLKTPCVPLVSHRSAQIDVGRSTDDQDWYRDWDPLVADVQHV